VARLDLDLTDSRDSVKFMAATALVFAIIAAFCSSPQTAELNAHARSETLMKWVALGLGTSAVFIYIAAGPMKGGKPTIYGGALAGAMLGLAYVYANKSGLKSGEPPTEHY
jgi:hypothetical protein